MSETHPRANGHDTNIGRSADRPHLEAIRGDVAEVLRLFASKNANYAAEEDPWMNFRCAQPVKLGFLTPLQYCMTLVSKQDAAAVLTSFAPTTERRAELRERLLDGIVYRLIALRLMEDENG